MVRLNYIPNILKKDGRIVMEVPFVPAQTVERYCSENKIDLTDCRIVLSGKIADKSTVVSYGDEIMILPNVEGGVVAAVIAIFKIIAIVATVVSVGYAIYQAVTYKKPTVGGFGTASMGMGSDMTESSPTYGWDGIVTTQEVGRPVPIIYGEHKCGGEIINSFVSNDGDKSYLNCLLALCEGVIDSISSIAINDNPIANYTGVTTYERYGTNDQTVIPNFEDLNDVHNVNAQLLKDNAYTYTSVGTGIEAFELYLRFPIGLYSQNQSNGSIESWSVTYKVEYKLHSAEEWTDLGSTTVSDKTRSVLRRIYRKDGLTAGQYDIRVTRTSDDSSFYNIGDLYLYSVSEITTDDLAYPNTALLGLKLLATDQISGGVPNITCIVKGTKVLQPKIMNGETEVDWEDYYWDDDDEDWKLIEDDTVLSWDEATYVTKWCANPAWCMRDLLVSSRYGLGEFMTTAHIDLASFLEMAKWCDELVPDGSGGYEKRMRFDVVIDSATRASDLIAQIASAFRGMAFYSDGTIKFKVDKPESMVQIFGMGNIIKGTFQQQWRSKRDIYNVIEVQYLDSEKGYRQQRVACIDEAGISAGDPVRKRQIQIFTTRITQALREGRYAMLTNKHVDESITFKAAIDAVAVQAGDVIGICHDLPQWGYSGRVQAGSTTSVVKLDQTVVISAGSTYKVKIRFADDTIEERTVTDTAGSYTQVNVSPAFSQAPSAYDVYAFGRENVLVKPFRVISLQKENTHEVTITAIEHNSNVYDDSAVVIPDDNFSELNTDFPEVTNLVLEERLVKLPDGTIEDAIDVSFQKPDDSGYILHKYQKARIYLSDDAGESWELKGEATGQYFQILGGIIDGGLYRVAVVTVDVEGTQMPIGEAPYDDITVVGKTTPPSDVTGFAVSFATDRLVFSWNEVTDVDLECYEIRELPFSGAAWSLGTVIATGITELTKDLFSITTGQKYYAIKAIDTSGNYSTNYDDASINITSIPEANVVATFEDTDFSGSLSGDAELCYLIGYNENYYRKAISFRSDILWDTGNWDDGGYWDKDFDTTSTGVYITPSKDLGGVFNADISLEIGLANVAGGALQIEIAYSDSDSAPTNWTNFATGQYSGRYFRFRLTISTADASYGVDLYKFKATFDVPDKTQEGLNVSVAGTGWTTITLTGFTSVATLIISVRGNAYIVQTDESAIPASFNVKLLDPADSMAQKAGAINYYAKGY